MRNLIRSLLSALVITLSAGSSPVWAGSGGPVAGLGAEESGDPCGEAFAEFGAYSALYTATLIYCPLASCSPLTYQLSELLLRSAVMLTYACAI